LDSDSHLGTERKGAVGEASSSPSQNGTQLANITALKIEGNTENRSDQVPDWNREEAEREAGETSGIEEDGERTESCVPYPIRGEGNQPKKSPGGDGGSTRHLCGRKKYSSSGPTAPENPAGGVGRDPQKTRRQTKPRNPGDRAQGGNNRKRMVSIDAQGSDETPARDQRTRLHRVSAANKEKSRTLRSHG